MSASSEDLGAVNGFIEEMLDGQKVVKVFCHEEKAKEDFRKRQRRAARQRRQGQHATPTSLMPVNANIGNISYVLVRHRGRACWRIERLAGADAGHAWYPSWP